MSDDRDQALTVAFRSARDRVQPVFTLDRRLEDLARRTRDPMVAQMRLTWWYEALGGLDAATVPAEPLLATLAAEVLPAGVKGASLAALANGWEGLLAEQPLGESALARFARERGGTLFAAAATLLDTDVDARAGEAWALADLAATIGPPDRDTAISLAEARWRDATASRWLAAARPLGVLALLALLPLRSHDGTGGALSAAWRVTRFRLIGR